MRIALSRVKLSRRFGSAGLESSMSNGDVLEELHGLRTQFGVRRGRKYRVLSNASKQDIGDPGVLRRYHEILLFMAAYPDDRATLQLAENELRRIARISGELVRSHNRRVVRRLDDSGIAGTVNHCSFSLDGTEWLCRRFARDVDLHWEDDSAGDGLDEFLPSLGAHVERDGAISDRLTTRAWVNLATGAKRSSVSWLLEHFRALGCSGDVLDRAFDSLDLYVRWVLRERAASRTFIRFPPRRLFFQREGLFRRVLLPDELRKPLPAARRMDARAAASLLDACRATLCVRHRETDPLTYANPKEVTLFSLERGVDVALIGTRPDRRLPIESFFGFVAARNRVPVGYGGGWIFFDRCEIGVNIFDTFRGGESAFIFAQVLRVFVQHYGAEYVTVDPFQIGAGNPEAIQSGAFWFYYRLGFRPKETNLRQLADGEWSRIQADRSYRSSAGKLRRLAQSKLSLELGTDANMDDLELSDIALSVTKRVGGEFGGNSIRAERAASVEVMRRLGVRGRSKWSPFESAAFDRLSLLAVMIPELGTWSVDEKKSLFSLMRAKGGRCERTYVRRLRDHRRFESALKVIARAGRRATAHE